MTSIELEGGFTRSSFILRGALAAGAVYGAGAVAPFVSRSFAAVGTTDIEILQFALGLERLETAFYAAANKQAGLSGRVKEISQEFFNHESKHTETIEDLITALGAKPNPAAKAQFKGLSDEKSFLEMAVTLEETGISAYNGAAPAIESTDLIEAAGGIVQVEARHAGALRMLAGQDPAPRAFDEALPPEQITQRVRPYLQQS